MTDDFDSEQALAGNDGHIIRARISEPAVAPGGIIQVLHGLAEHCARYAGFASAATKRGYVVITHDHRGHGRHAETPGHFADADGWNRVIADVGVVNDWSRKRWADTPFVVLGHSMGSFIAQGFAMRRPASMSALILSGSTLPSRFETRLGRLLARFERWRHGRRGHSALLDKLGLGRFNDAFQPPRTAFDWLSRDTGEVDKYMKDPLCGASSTCQLWIDLMGGLLEISGKAAYRKIPPGLPMLIFGGSDDPVGGERGLTALADAYRSSGQQDLTLKIYTDGRHEMFNEINRDEVTADVLEWIDGAVARPA